MKQERHLPTQIQSPPPPPRRPTTLGYEEYPLPPGLTPRGIDILKLVIEGLDNKQISQCLRTPLRNIEKYLINIQMKVDMDNQESPLSYLLKNRC